MGCSASVARGHGPAPEAALLAEEAGPAVVATLRSEQVGMLQSGCPPFIFSAPFLRVYCPIYTTGAVSMSYYDAANTRTMGPLLPPVASL